MTMFRADVLRLLPEQLTAPEIQLAALVNGSHAVTLPEAGTGNQVPQSAGASCLSSIGIGSGQTYRVYDGISVQAPGATTTQTIRGFYQASAAHAAKLTHIGGSGAPNSSDRLWFNASLVSSNPFMGAASPASDRAWAGQTVDVTSLMPTDFNFNDGYGTSVTTTIDHVKASPYDCLSWAAIIFSTTVPDTDGDGIPDKLEDVGGLKTPTGEPLPDLHAMGASSMVKDLFVEIGFMASDGYTGGQGVVPAHSHLPTPAALKMVGDAFRSAPDPIHVHFDVGNHYQSGEAGPYIVPGSLARGGESILERACDPERVLNCQFPGYPGTVSWKIGFQLYRDALVADDGSELSPEGVCPVGNTCHRRRFDQVRKDIFRYTLFAHARGIPKSVDPASPDFHVPRGSSGVSDLPGGDSMVSLGFWDNFVGTDFTQAATLMHELGHNFDLTHGGVRQLTRLPNCKPNYPSVMNYLFQLRGRWTSPYPSPWLLREVVGRR
jgi:hypothetical protein